MAIWPGLAIFVLVLSFNLLATACATPSIRASAEALSSSSATGRSGGEAMR